MLGAFFMARFTPPLLFQEWQDSLCHRLRGDDHADPLVGGMPEGRVLFHPLYECDDSFDR